MRSKTDEMGNLAHGAETKNKEKNKNKNRLPQRKRSCNSPWRQSGRKKWN